MKPTTLELNKKLAEYMGTKEFAMYYIDDNTWDGGHSLEHITQKCNNYKRQGLNVELRERVVVIEDYTESLDAQIPIVKKYIKEIQEMFGKGIASTENILKIHLDETLKIDCDSFVEASAYALYYAIERSKEK